MTSDHPVFALADRFVDELAAVRPVEATLAGVGGHDHRWGDLGPDGVAAREAVLRATLDELRVSPPTEDRWARLAVRVLTDELEAQLEQHEAGEPLLDLRHVASTIPDTREALEVLDLDHVEGREALVRRLETYDAALAGWRRTLDEGRRTGKVVARRQVHAVAEQLREIARPDGPLQRVAAAAQAADGVLTDRLAAALPTARAAADDAADWLEGTYLPDAAAQDGCGRDRYERSARVHLGADIDLAETYAWAWERIADLTERARRVAHEIAPGEGLPATIAMLRHDPTYAAPGPDAFREAMQVRQTSALEALEGRHFDVPPPVRRVEVRLAGGGPLGAYYNGPSEDFERPGTIWWSLPGDGPVPLYEEVSTAYHEGFPGHHLQIGTQVSLADRLSRAHRTFIWNPGYGEGWALYTEQLMDELGLLEHPVYVLGYLASELLRATRVVVDIGLHLGWSLPERAPLHPGEAWDARRAVDALRQLAFLPDDYAESEVRRYLGWPAQAISYAVGQRVIVELREERRRRDGAAFDLKAFHADVLGSGPVGLELLREVVLAEAAGG